MNIPKGFKITSGKIGLRNNKAKDDFVIVLSDKIADCAGVFTRNTFFGAPIGFTKNQIINGNLQAIAIGAGNANVATGKQGERICEKTAGVISKNCGIHEGDVGVAYTGIIGRKIPDELIDNNLPLLLNNFDNDFEKAARAIMTTDTKIKLFTTQIGQANLLLFCKGAGMIHPNMGTMLAFALTDALISHSDLDNILRKSVDKSFNQVSVDGDMSTSDMFLIMANGLSGEVPLDEFQLALDDLCIKASKAMANDGEGASKSIEIVVYGNLPVEDSRKIASKVITSNLVKCAIFGSDPNWGRILAAAGSTLIPFNINEVSLKICEISVFKNGEPDDTCDYTKLHDLMKERSEIIIELYIGEGGEKARGWGCDLTNEYVNFNALYHT